MRGFDRYAYSRTSLLIDKSGQGRDRSSDIKYAAETLGTSGQCRRCRQAEARVLRNATSLYANRLGTGSRSGASIGRSTPRVGPISTGKPTPPRGEGRRCHSPWRQRVWRVEPLAMTLGTVSTCSTSGWPRPYRAITVGGLRPSCHKGLKTVEALQAAELIGSAHSCRGGETTSPGSSQNASNSPLD